MLLLFLHYLLNNKKRKYKIIKILFINLFILFNFICAAPIKLEEEEENQNNMDKENKQFMNRIRIKALNNIQRSLESLNELTATSLLLKTALESNELINEDDEINEKNTKLFFNEENTKIKNKNKNFGLKRIKADLRRIPLTTTTSSNELFNNKNEWENEEEIFNEIATSSSSSTTAPTRRHRSAVNVVAVQREQQHLKNNGLHYNSQHHRRRKKGCPSVHGKDQLLCPSRNTYRYDVCITREQLCDRIRDCPGGEDEDSRHCFFFRPLESSLKTISHAVLLLVDTVMREQQENQRLEKRNEL